ncbi:unnamed protein product [Symbiodinium sp. KB8]|nr:unnamed protein product [Symbiodinium sp. KB8]
MWSEPHWRLQPAWPAYGFVRFAFASIAGNWCRFGGSKGNKPADGNANCQSRRASDSRRARALAFKHACLSSEAFRRQRPPSNESCACTNAPLHATPMKYW